MSKQIISIGASINDGTGDPLRTAFGKVNDNFTELYTSVSSLQAADNDLTAIAGLTGTTGFLKKTATDTWALDNNTYLTSINSSQVVAALGYTPYNGATNTSGFLTGITSGQVTTALGYTPYNSTNPNGYLSSITSSQVTTALGFTPYNSTNPNGYLSSITSSQVTTALGYTPIQANSLSVTTASASGGGSLSYNNTTGVFTFTPPSLSGYLTSITSSQVTTALGYTPYNGSTNPNNYITLTGLSITTASASGGGSLSYSNTTGVFTFTPPSLSGYLSSITSSQVTTALGYTPYNGSTNPNNYLTGITSSQVTTALGFTPYNSTNPNNYLTGITSSQVTTALGYTPIQANSLSVTTSTASGGGSLSYSGGVFTFTPASVPTLGTGVAAFLLNPTSATLAAALSDESGTNTVAFTTSPTFITPTLGNASATSLAITGGTLSVSSGVSAPTWGLTGAGISAPGATYTDTTSTGTVATVEAIHSLNNPILASTLATTFTSATTLYLGTPSAGANVTITNAYSLYAAGGILLGGTLTANSTISLVGSSSATASIGTSITTGTITIGGTTSTGTITLGQSTGAQTYNIGTGATLAATTKTINIGTAGVSTSITNIAIGSAVSGSTTNLTLNGSLAVASAITSAQSVGYIGYPQNSTATGITLALTDIGKHIYVTATGQTITIPANSSVAFPIGTEILIVGGPTSTTTSIAITTDTLYLSSAGTTGTRTLAAYGMARLLKVTSTTWYIRGDGLT